MVYGYIRVSSREQNIDRQMAAVSEFVRDKKNVFIDKQSDIFVVDFPLLDTRSRDKDLTGIFISDLVLQILSYVAQTEREFIHQRQAEGIACAKQKGVKFGRAENALPQGFESAKEKYISGELSVRQAAALCGMKYSTFYKKIHKNCL